LVRNAYYPKYETFRAKAFQFLNNLHQEVEDWKGPMVEKFQIIDVENIRA